MLVLLLLLLLVVDKGGVINLCARSEKGAAYNNATGLRGSGNKTSFDGWMKKRPPRRARETAVYASWRTGY